jgi:hypothetical protein
MRKSFERKRQLKEAIWGTNEKQDTNITRTT